MPVRGETKKPETKKTEEVAGKTVKKNPFKEKVLKYLEGVEKGLSKKVQEIKAIKVAETGQPKVDIAFVVFSGNGPVDEEANEEENVELIKKVLFHYHTATDKTGTKVVGIQVIVAEEEDEPSVLSYQEYDVNQ